MFYKVQRIQAGSEDTIGPPGSVQGTDVERSTWSEQCQLNFVTSPPENAIELPRVSSEES
jgi:hypothetical protein